MDTRNTGNVIGGHKANLANPNTSKEAKQHSKEVLSELGSETSSSSRSNPSMTSDERGGREKNKGNVIGGYKAAMHNPNVSDEAKEHARKVVEDME